VFRGGNRTNGSGITFQTLGDLKVFGTNSSLDGQSAIFRMTSDVNGRLVKCAFTFPADIVVATDTFDTTLLRFDNDQLTFDDNTP